MLVVLCFSRRLPLQSVFHADSNLPSYRTIASLIALHPTRFLHSMSLLTSIMLLFQERINLYYILPSAWLQDNITVRYNIQYRFCTFSKLTWLLWINRCPSQKSISVDFYWHLRIFARDWYDVELWCCYSCNFRHKWILSFCILICQLNRYGVPRFQL